MQRDCGQPMADQCITTGGCFTHRQWWRFCNERNTAQQLAKHKRWQQEKRIKAQEEQEERQVRNMPKKQNKKQNKKKRE